MATSPIYRSALLYELVIRLLYGRHYAARYRAIADLLPDGSSVLDICCGPATIYHRYLKQKSILYTGLDISTGFVADLRKRGANGEIWDLRSEAPLPPADAVIIQASLYHFLPDAAPIVDRMLAAAQKQVIVSETVRNVTSSRIPLLGFVGRYLTDSGNGAQHLRFTEASLDSLFARYQANVSSCFLIPGGREKVYILAKGSGRP